MVGGMMLLEHPIAPPPEQAPFRKQVEQLVPRLRARAVQLCRNPNDAQDLVQDTVERALRFEHQFEPGTNLRAWLNKVLFSVFVSRLRSRSRERRVLDVLAADPCAWTQPDPAPVMQSLPVRLSRAVESLPEQFAETLCLVDLHELAYKDTAERLQVPVGTVMSRLHRARRMLQHTLEAEVPAPQAA